MNIPNPNNTKENIITQVITSFPIGGNDELVWLNNMFGVGWELITVVSKFNSTIYFFKRAK